MGTSKEWQACHEWTGLLHWDWTITAGGGFSQRLSGLEKYKRCFYKHIKPRHFLFGSLRGSLNKLWLYNALVISCNAYVFVNWAQWTLATLWPTLSPNICLLQLSLNSTQAWLFLPFPRQWGSDVYSGAKRNSSKSASSNLFDRRSGHSQLPNLHPLFLTPTLFFIIWSKIFCFESLNSVLSHGNSVSCVDMTLRNYSSPPNTTSFSMLRFIFSNSNHVIFLSPRRSCFSVI